MDTIRLFIIEEQPMILQNRVKILGSYNLDIVGTARSGEDAILTLQKMNWPPDIVLCDFDLPKMSGLETIEKIKSLHPKTGILIFLNYAAEDRLLEAISAKASGYLLKGVDDQKIYQAIIDVFHGGTVIQPELAGKLLKYFTSPKEKLKKRPDITKPSHLNELLTIRELECLQIIAKGLSNHEAALVLNLSKATIRTHLEHIYQKLEVNNRVEAVTEGIRQGIIDL